MLPRGQERVLTGRGEQVLAGRGEQADKAERGADRAAGEAPHSDEVSLGVLNYN